MGTANADTIALLAGNDTYRALAGDDLAGDDLAYGNQGDDLVYGNMGADRLYGGQNNDRLYGGQDNDTLYGNKGEDVAGEFAIAADTLHRPASDLVALLSRIDADHADGLTEIVEAADCHDLVGAGSGFG